MYREGESAVSCLRWSAAVRILIEKTGGICYLNGYVSDDSRGYTQPTQTKCAYIIMYPPDTNVNPSLRSMVQRSP